MVSSGRPRATAGVRAHGRRFVRRFAPSRFPLCASARWALWGVAYSKESARVEGAAEVAAFPGYGTLTPCSRRRHLIRVRRLSPFAIQILIIIV